jgi:hypothetical protein
MMDAEQLKTLVIMPTLRDLVLYSDEAIQLLLFTCANESLGGSFLKQVSGPALGIYQMEPETYNDIWQNYINFKSDLRLKFTHAFDIYRMPPEDRLIYDLRFATAMTRIHYDRIPEPLPKLNDLDGMWTYYKKYYNSTLGKADYHQTIANYQRFITPFKF